MEQVEASAEAANTQMVQLEQCQEQLRAAVELVERYKADYVSAERRFGNQGITIFKSLGAIITTGGVLALERLPASTTNKYMTVCGAYMLGQVLDVASAEHRRNKLKKSVVETPLHSRIKIYRAEMPYAQVQPGDTILSVEPGVPDSKATGEKLSQARGGQLTELLAVTNDAEYDHIILPSYLLRRPPDPRQTRSRILSSVTGCAVSKADDVCVELLTKAEFSNLASYAEQASGSSLLHTVLTQLNQAVPNKYVELFLQNKTDIETVRPYIDRYIRQVLLRHLDARLESTYAVGPGTEEDPALSRPHLTNQLVSVNGNLSVQQVNDKLQIIYAHSVARLAAIKEPIGSFGFWSKLNAKGYSPAQTAYLAVGLLQAAVIEADTSATAESIEADLSPQLEPHYLPDAGDLISARLHSQERRHRLRRSIGAGLLMLSLFGGIKFGVEVLPEPPSSPPVSTLIDKNVESLGQFHPEDKTDWVIDDYGLDPTGYYFERVFNIFNPKEGWQSTHPISYIENIPFTQSGERAPRLTLKRAITLSELSYGVWLPVHEDTTLAHVRVVAEDGTPIPSVSLYSDGTGYMVRPATNVGGGRAGNFRLEADFVYRKLIDPFDNGDGIMAAKQREAQTEQAQLLAQQTAQDFSYDNTSALDKITDHIKNEKSFLAAMDKMHICNCNLCATRVALLARQQGISADFAAGYINIGKGPASDSDVHALSSTEKHGWVQSNNTIVDPTPSRLTKAEAKARSKKPVSPHPSADTNPYQLLTMFLPLGALVVGGAGEVGLHHIRKSRRQKWLNSPHTQEAYNFLNWVTYGRLSSPPALNTFAPKTPQQLDASIKSDLLPSTLRSYLNNQPWQYENAARLNYRQLFRVRRLARRVISQSRRN